MSLLLIIFLIIIIVLFEKVLENLNNFSPATKSISSEMIKQKLQSPISRLFAIQRNLKSSKFDLPLHVSPKKAHEHYTKPKLDLPKQFNQIKLQVTDMNNQFNSNNIYHMELTTKCQSQFNDLFSALPPPPWLKRSTLGAAKEISILTHKPRVPLIRL